MRLEYNEEQERRLRIIELESILENNLYNTELEKFSFEVELQFLQDSKDGYKSPIAYIEIETGETLEIIYEIESEQYSMLIYDAFGHPSFPYYNANTVEELLMLVIK